MSISVQHDVLLCAHCETFHSNHADTSTIPRGCPSRLGCSWQISSILCALLARICPVVSEKLPSFGVAFRPSQEHSVPFALSSEEPIIRGPWVLFVFVPFPFSLLLGNSKAPVFYLADSFCLLLKFCCILQSGTALFSPSILSCSILCLFFFF